MNATHIRRTTGLNGPHTLRFERLETRALLSSTGYGGSFAVFTDLDLDQIGLVGSYVDQNLQAVDQLDWRISQSISGTRIDHSVFFATPSFGNRNEVGITGGTDENWDNFSVQWDGVVQILDQGTQLALRSDASSRMWIDINGDDTFAMNDELIDNEWGTPHSASIGESSAPLAIGEYKIRIQYQETLANNTLSLIANPIQPAPDPSHIVRVAYLIPENRTAQEDAVGNIQDFLPRAQSWYREQMDRNGFGKKTFHYEREADGITPKVHVVHVGVEGAFIRENVWNNANSVATAAGVTNWTPGEVWLLVPETHVENPDGSIVGGVALGAGFGSGSDPGVAIIGSSMLFRLDEATLLNDNTYAGNVVPEVGPYPLVHGVSFPAFERGTFSTIASSAQGAAIHELSHGLGLGHDFRNDDNFHGNLMGNGLRGLRGATHPDEYADDDMRLAYAAAAALDVSRYFQTDTGFTDDIRPTLTVETSGSVTPVDGLLNIDFSVSDDSGLHAALLRRNGSTVGEMLLSGTSVSKTFSTPYYDPGVTDNYRVAVYDSQGNQRSIEVPITVDAGFNRAPQPFIRTFQSQTVPGDPVRLDASRTDDPDHNNASILIEWDLDGDGDFETTPTTNKVFTTSFGAPGAYLVSARATDPDGAQSLSAPIAIRVAEPKSPEPIKLTTGTLAAIGSTGWTTVNLPHAYESMVVVATPNYDANSVPLVTRIRNAFGDSFQIRVARTDGKTDAASADVHYFVVEEGVYTQADDGITMEARRYDSFRTDRKDSWTGRNVMFDIENTYTQPVVVGQVLTYNDSRWSTFWSRGASAIHPISSDSIYVGKHVGEDPETTRANEKIGYVIVESGSGVVDGIPFTAAVGADSVGGFPQGGGHYAIEEITNPTVAIVNQTGMGGYDGSWALLNGVDPVQNSGIALAVDEDQAHDIERGHVTEQISYLVFGGEVTSGPKLHHGNLVMVNNQDWTTVEFPNHYSSMVVVATPNYDGNTVPLVTRIQHATGNSFQIRLDRTDEKSDAVSASVHYFVVEAGVYSRANDGINLEARLIDSTITDSIQSWNGVDVTAELANEYSNPVVVGQVMTYNDADWSTFWSHGANRTNAVTADHVFVGKHVGEDSDTTRADERIGYVVMESGSGSVDGTAWVASVGSDTIDGFPQGGGQYAITGLSHPVTAVASQTGMEGYNGSWAVLDGPTALQPTQVKLAADEDQAADVERGHVTERVAVVVFGDPSVAGPKLHHGALTAVDNEHWTTVDLPFTYASMVVVATPNYDINTVPVVTRINHANDDSFQIRLDRTDRESELVTANVHYFVVEAGVYTQAQDGITMEARRVNSATTDAKDAWNGEDVTSTLGNTYIDPVVFGQVMSYNDADWSAFWSHGYDRSRPVSAQHVFIGKHVGEDADRTRADETIGYVVIESGNGQLDGLAWEAALGADSVSGFPQGGGQYATSLAGATTAVLSQSGMEGHDGSWAVLRGPTPVQPTRIILGVDEDQAADFERGHVAERVAYLVLSDTKVPAVTSNPIQTGSSTSERIDAVFAELQLELEEPVSSELSRPLISTHEYASNN